MDLINPLIKVIKTKDGSNTLYHNQFNEIYHSRHGAYNESMHVFIQMGLHFMAQSFKPLKILEVGFGTGLNCILSLVHKRTKIEYTGIDTFPINWATIEALDYAGLQGILNFKQAYRTIIETAWNTAFELNPEFSFTKLNTSIFEIDFTNSYHLIYFDAFAPGIQPAMWETPVFKKLYEILEDNGCLVTYCAKGQVRRNLQAAGFSVDRVEGPPGKREMLRAVKD